MCASSGPEPALRQGRFRHGSGRLVSHDQWCQAGTVAGSEPDQFEERPCKSNREAGLGKMRRLRVLSLAEIVPGERFLVFLGDDQAKGVAGWRSNPDFREGGKTADRSLAKDSLDTSLNRDVMTAIHVGLRSRVV